MKQDWEIRTLGKVVTKASSNVSQNQLTNEKGNYPIYGASGFIKNVSFYHRDKDYISIVKDGAGIGRITLLKAYSSVIGTSQYLIPNENINIRFLFYFLNGVDFNKYKQGSTIPHIYFKDYAEAPILVPPLPEQKRIVKILDEAFAAINKAKENAEKNLQNAKDLFENVMREAFSGKENDWEQKGLGAICGLMTGGTPSRSKLEYFNKGTIKWLVSGDVNIGEIHDCEGRITELGMKSSNTKYLPVNSVVIALNGQGKTRGTVAILRTKATCNQSLVSIYPKDIKKILPEYIYFNLKVRYLEIRKMTGDSGNDRRGLNMPLIRSIKISYPNTVKKQQDFIDKFKILSAQTKKLETVYQQKLNDLEELKKSVLQKAFAGELKTEGVGNAKQKTVAA